ncbi:DUF1365 family protein [Jiangella mangrovi]|uniref:DUF1365 family protein n=1 Tax=Jiangella mangrovi TaxID=1524084 RepID=A0A7W9GMY9_9ACTN|nr:DUF1365 family protein [Jiangella mangrovi]
MVTAPALYAARVRHTRYERVRRTFGYRTYLWLVDVDDLPRLPRPLRALAAFRARDHFAGSAPTIRAGLESWLATRGMTLDGGRVLMLANAAVLGYVFNPITVFWCLGAGGETVCVVTEVHNTYGGRHAYVLRPDEQDRATTAKELYVSPFFPVDGSYAMTVPRPGRRLRLSVTLTRPGPDGDRLAFAASLTGRRRPATVPHLFRLLLRHPWAPLRVTALIRWQGIRLWLRRVPVVPRPQGEPR